MKLTFALLAASTFALTACGDDGGQGHADAGAVNCAVETRADPYVAGMEAVGTNGYKVKLMTSTPAPPSKGDNTWELQVLSGDTPVDGMTVDVTPFMPDHGHGTPIGADITAGGSDGMYSAAPVNLWMPGFWTVTVAIEDDQGTELDSVVFNTCIDG